VDVSGVPRAGHTIMGVVELPLPGPEALAACGEEEELEALRRRVWELEALLQSRDELLVGERARGAKARRKARQLLAKLAERDEALAELRVAFHDLKSCGVSREALHNLKGCGASPDGQSSPSLSPASPLPSAQKQPDHQQRGRLDSAAERAAIVAALEGHLAQMRVNHAESLREVRDLEEKRWSLTVETAPEDVSAQCCSPSRSQRLVMISSVCEEKKRFASELTQKMRNLEERLAQQRALLGTVDVGAARGGSHRGGRSAAKGGDAEGSGGGGSSSGSAGAAPAAAAGFTFADGGSSAGEEGGRGAAPRCRGHDSGGGRSRCGAGGGWEEEGAQEATEVLQTFLENYGEIVEGELRTALEARPPRLAGPAALEGCSPGGRARAFGLFAAWATAAEQPPPRAACVSDISLQLPDALALRDTLETCSGQLESWEMTRCPAGEAALQALLRGLAAQPLRRLNLGYNTLGQAGAAALAGALLPPQGDQQGNKDDGGGARGCKGPSGAPLAARAASTLEYLGLEMNGLGDGGCGELARALTRALLPGLRSLELGWNEVSVASVAPLAGLLTVGGCPQLGRLGLAGNKLGTEGARVLSLAALGRPRALRAVDRLELDVSMNHVDAGLLAALAEWAETSDAARYGPPSVTIGLEWNIVDDPAVVLRLARALAVAGGMAATAAWAGGAGTAPEPLVRLANNEVVEGDLSPSEVLAESRGLVQC